MRTFLYKQFKTHSILLANAASLISTVAVTSVLGFVYWWLATRQFPPEAVGLGSAAISAMTLIGTIGILGLGTLLIGELPRHKGNEGSLISGALILVGVVGGCSGIAFAVAAPYISTELRALGGSVDNVAIFAVGVSLTAITLVLDQALIGLLRSDLQLWRNALFAAAKLVALFIAGLWLSHKVGLTIYATWAIGNGFSLVVLAIFALLKGHLFRNSYRPQWRLLRSLRTAALQHHLFNLILAAPTMALPVLVTVLLSATMNAWFAVSLMLTTFVFVVPYSLATVLYVMGSAQPDTLTQKTRLTLGIATVSGVLALVVLLLGAKQVLSLFGHTYAEQAVWCLRILAFGVFPQTIKNHFVTLCRIERRIAPVLLPMLAGSLLELVLPALGARLGGLSGLSLGWVVAGCIESVFMLRLVYKVVRPSTASIATNSTRHATTAQL